MSHTRRALTRSDHGADNRCRDFIPAGRVSERRPARHTGGNCFRIPATGTQVVIQHPHRVRWDKPGCCALVTRY